ncbi:hypothetical protein L1987_08700 [Smallanthus sonchifolius]|uniref:Uncharacterized protein n=1 Tax=Smallanthus sonchifolius TaxID=185202 RepID=A0ACB9JMH5_9ASTR|nr:hypothetical protein L1987_08700 [Smallanthus sonchifolius]
MVADASSTTTTPNSKVLSPSPAPANPNRAPLLPSGSDNNGRSLQRRPKSVTSRYLSYTTSSKVVTDTKSSSNAVCTPRKRFPAPVVPVSSASPVSNRRDQSVERRRSSTKTSARSLSVSFQGESFALPVSKVGKPENNVLRSRTPERKKTPAMTGKVSEFWRSRQVSFMTMSVDFTAEKMKLTGSETAGAVRAKLEHNNLETACDCENSDHPVSDTESMSSGSTLGNVRGGGPRAIVVPARFWQETINLLRRVQPVPVSPPLFKNISISGCKVLHDGSKLPSPRGSSFSPSPVSNLGNTASILSFCADSKRGKVGEKKLVDAHVLRLLHNKHMQWRFANAKKDAAMVVQRAAAQVTFCSSVWVTIENCYKGDEEKSIQRMGDYFKVVALCHIQTTTDATIEPQFEVTLSTQETAVDVMEAMAVSVCSLVTKMENVNSMASELAIAMKTECSLLDQCNDLLSALTLLEVSLQAS